MYIVYLTKVTLYWFNLNCIKKFKSNFLITNQNIVFFNEIETEVILQTLCFSQDKATKIWDSSDCVCRCREVKECQSGFHLDERKCECISVMYTIYKVKLFFSKIDFCHHAMNFYFIYITFLIGYMVELWVD